MVAIVKKKSPSHVCHYYWHSLTQYLVGTSIRPDKNSESSSIIPDEVNLEEEEETWKEVRRLRWTWQNFSKFDSSADKYCFFIIKLICIVSLHLRKRNVTF